MEGVGLSFIDAMGMAHLDLAVREKERRVRGGCMDGLLQSN